MVWLSSSKAVADGAVIWNTISSVAGRAPRSSYGIEVTARYNPVLAEHQGREVYHCASGQEKVDGVWSQIVAKVRTVNISLNNYQAFPLWNSPYRGSSLTMRRWLCSRSLGHIQPLTPIWKISISSWLPTRRTEYQVG